MQMQILKSKLILEHGVGTMRGVPGIQTTSDPVSSWRELNAAHATVHAALDHALRREHDLSPIEFEVLDRLGECSTGKARMQELADTAHATQSTISRVVARLEDEGLATRAMCPDDRRGIFACMTDAGRERLAAAAPTYRRVIAETLGPR
jgi:DNA-binding MarR family transcriptional regulator